MTTFEHGMLASSGVIVCGLHARWGWKIVALAAVAAIAPDWDGLTVLFDTGLFDRGHRVWGHNVFACGVVGIMLGTTDYQWDVSGRIASRLARLKPFSVIAPYSQLRTEWTRAGAVTWVLVAIGAALTQIPADAVVSGGRGLADWPIKLFWPVSDLAVVYPLVQWGDPWPTIVFGVGMIAAARFPTRLRMIASFTLAGVVAYMLVRGLVFR